jgi:hypothetical protein
LTYHLRLRLHTLASRFVLPSHSTDGPHVLAAS